MTLGTRGHLRPACAACLVALVACLPTSLPATSARAEPGGESSPSASLGDQPCEHEPGDETDHDHHHAATTDLDGTAQPGTGTPTALVWEPQGTPMVLRNLDIGFTDQDGHTGTLAELIDRPVLLTFFYTRCQNSRKCPMTVSRLAGLQRQLRNAGLDDRVRLLAVTFEPRFDTPARLERYVLNRGLVVGPHARALRLEPTRLQELVDDLAVPVSYNAGWVNGHAVELNLLDAEGRLVRKYHSLAWQGPRVIDDLRHLLGDGDPAAAGPAGTAGSPHDRAAGGHH